MSFESAVTALLVLLLSACSSREAVTEPAARPLLAFVDPAGGAVLAEFRVELAVNSAERQQGLMFRRELAPDAGMLFIFDTEEDHDFWMRNTYIPLDMVFITAQGVVAGTIRDAKPLNDRQLSIGVPSKYVLEIPAGTCFAKGIRRGVIAKPGPGLTL